MSVNKTTTIFGGSTIDDVLQDLSYIQQHQQQHNHDPYMNMTNASNNNGHHQSTPMANHHYYYQPQSLNRDLIEQQSHAMINPNLISGQNSQFVVNSNYMNNMQRFMSVHGGQQDYNAGGPMVANQSYHQHQSQSRYVNQQQPAYYPTTTNTNNSSIMQNAYASHRNQNITGYQQPKMQMTPNDTMYNYTMPAYYVSAMPDKQQQQQQQLNYNNNYNMTHMQRQVPTVPVQQYYHGQQQQQQQQQAHNNQYNGANATTGYQSTMTQAHTYATQQHAIDTQHTTKPVFSAPVSIQQHHTQTQSKAITDNNNTYASEYAVVPSSDSNRLSIKLARKPPVECGDQLMATVNAIQHTKSDIIAKQQHEHAKVVVELNKPKEPALPPSKTEPIQVSSQAVVVEDTKKKAKPRKAKAQLQTWQNLTPTVELPSDFTPELIAQLQAEGYGVPRKRAKAQPVTKNDDDDDDDDDNDDQDDDNTGLRKSSSKSATSNREHTAKKMPTLQRDHRLSINMDFVEPSDCPSFKRFTQLIDDLFESYDQDFHQTVKFTNTTSFDHNDHNNDTNDDYLISKQLCEELTQEAFKLNAYDLICLIKKESLVKLQVLLYFNINDGIKQLAAMVGTDAADTMSANEVLLRDLLYDKQMRGADACILSLLIMTANRVSKEVLIEDLIEQIALFVKTHLLNTIYPQFDSSYKSPNDLLANFNGKNTTPNAKRPKLKDQQQQQQQQQQNKTSHQNAKRTQRFYNRIREILSLFGELIKMSDLTDTIVITISTVCIQCFFIDNINDLQLESMRLLTNVFAKYDIHRHLIIDDILSSIAKLQTTKRNLRTYKCLNGDSIQMLSALSMQLIQSEVSSADDDHNNTNSPDNNVLYDEHETIFLNTYENASQTGRKFLSVFFHKCKNKQFDFDLRQIFENFVQDLLVTANKPEWPVAEFIINMLGIILVNQINNERNDVATRVNSLDYLGQIVAQLRKDSVDLKKQTSQQPDKLNALLDRVNANIEWLSDTTTTTTAAAAAADVDQELVVLKIQKALIFYMESLEVNDACLVHAKRFFIAQCLKELNAKAAAATATTTTDDDNNVKIERYSRLEKHRKELYSLLRRDRNATKQEGKQNILDYAEAVFLGQYLTSLKKSLDKNFDYYLVNILNLLGSATEHVPTQVRSKALKCLSLIIEADTQVLLKHKVFQCVQANFLHQTISVREAAVDLIGRFICLKPELTTHYYQLLSDRILDVGVSVRKRVIKIFRDICMSQVKFDFMCEICVKMLRRVNDEDGIRKLVIDTFYNLWFTPLANNHAQHVLLDRVLNIVDVISEFNTNGTNGATSANCTQTSEFFEQLFNSLIVHSPHNQTTDILDHHPPQQQQQQVIMPTTTSTEQQQQQQQQQQKSKDVLRSCKQIVDCLVDNVLNIEAKANTANGYKRLVACFSTLYLFSKIIPENFVHHAETILPYLNIKSSNQNDNQIINNAARILECVTPLLHCPSESFLVSLEESLCKLILTGGMTIVNSCINCLGTVVNKLTKNYKLAADCLLKFYKNGVIIRSSMQAKPLESINQPTKAYAFRMLYTLGLLSKQFDLDSDDLKQFQIFKKEDLYGFFMFFVNQSDCDMKHKALIGLGSFLTKYHTYMLNQDIKTLYLGYLMSNGVQVALKAQVFQNLTDYLNEEDKRNLMESTHLSKVHCKDDLKEMLDVQSGMASTIIQTYFRPILDSYLTANMQLRISAVNCLSQILIQGLVYPIECVPYLIAMTTDTEKKIQVKALTHLTNLQKAHPGFIQSKSIAGMNMSYKLHKIIQCHTASVDTMAVVRGIDDGTSANQDNKEILSLNHHLYSLLRTTKQFRRVFVGQLLKMFNDTSNYHASLGHLLFICDNLAYFPYQMIDEPLYIIHRIDIIISVTGVNILQSFKENLVGNSCKSSRPVDEPMTEQTTTTTANDEIKDFDVDIVCPIGDDDDVDNKVADAEADTLILARKMPAKIFGSDMDDEDETIDKVVENFPVDLRPLRECMMNAQGCCLLLILKQFLKEVYSITDIKIQNYSPTDTAKINDRPITSRKTNIKFSPKQIIEYLQQSVQTDVDEHQVKHKLAQEYIEFRELMLSIDCEDDDKDDDEKRQSVVNTPKSAAPNAATTTCALKQKLMEGIEKVKVAGNDNQMTTPRKNPRLANSRRHQNSSAKKSVTKKRKRRRDYDDSSDTQSDNADSDTDEDL